MTEELELWMVKTQDGDMWVEATEVDVTNDGYLIFLIKEDVITAFQVGYWKVYYQCNPFTQEPMQVKLCSND